MPNTAFQIRKNVNHTYKSSEYNAIVFADAEKSYNKSLTGKTATLESIGNKVSSFWIVGCVLAIIGSVCLGYFQAYAAQTSVAGFLDPLAEGNVPQQVLLAIGIGISIIGLVLGHLITESIETDQYTDERKIKPTFWLFMLFGIFYVGFQYVMAKTAGDGVVNEGQIDYMPYVVAGLAIFELIIGAFVLEKALSYITLFVINIVLWFIQRKMRQKSRKTNNTYRDYLTLLEAHNRMDSLNPITREGNDNIRRAIAYYSNIKLEEARPEEEVEQVNTSEPVEDIIPVQETPKNNLTVASKTEEVKPATEVEPQVAEEHLEMFMEDTTEDDLTA